MRLFHCYRRLMAQVLGYEEELPEPASEEDLVAAEEEFGIALPPDLRALYGIADGDGDLVNPLFDRHEWFPLAEIGGLDDEWLDIAQEWQHEPWRRTVFNAQPPNTVRRSPLRAGWIRFASDTGGNWLAVDMDPGPAPRRPYQVSGSGLHVSAKASALPGRRHPRCPGPVVRDVGGCQSLASPVLHGRGAG